MDFLVPSGTNVIALNSTPTSIIRRLFEVMWTNAISLKLRAKVFDALLLLPSMRGLYFLGVRSLFELLHRPTDENAHHSLVLKQSTMIASLHPKQSVVRKFAQKFCVLWI